VISIRAFREEESFSSENERLLEVNQEVQFIVNGTQRWLDIKLSLISISVATGLSFFSVLRHQLVGNANAALLGLSLAYAFPMTGLLKGLIWSYTETEKLLISCERVFEYTEVESEKELFDDVEDVPFGAEWPKEGEIEFRHFKLSYRRDLPPVLKGINVHIHGGQHIGICGRTGSGKSSLYEALFRMRKYTSGQVLIDGIDISDIPLNRLRSSLCIIPQQPILIKGTIRGNLDPFNRKSDEQVWDALRKCGLESKVLKLENQLDSQVRSGAENFSLGERQLLTLARAFLQDAKIVCLDEATASIVTYVLFHYFVFIFLQDMETDHQIQSVLKQEFNDRTVLVIAHRIQTILDLDRIMVIQDGVVVKFDKPEVLIKDPDFKHQFL
jgi:ATP-binding cassette subfamily C (CFTR/MRP) protein 10